MCEGISKKEYLRWEDRQALKVDLHSLGKMCLLVMLCAYQTPASLNMS